MAVSRVFGTRIFSSTCSKALLRWTASHRAQTEDAQTRRRVIDVDAHSWRSARKAHEGGRYPTASEYRSAIPGTATLLQFDEKAAVLYARLRCDAALRAPDAIQLACAASFGVDLFITNDERLHGKRVDGIQVITPLSRAPI